MAHTSPREAADRPLEFLQGGGRMGALMRAHDWSSSPLGAPETWPQSLRSVVGLLLQSQFPMFVAWGPELGFLYNDPYAEILGAKHPRALGIRFYDIWSEIWTDISPLIDAALAGEATYREDLPLVIHRKGYDEHAWFTFSYSPVLDESGRIAGMFCAVSETTSKVLAERALRDNQEHLRALNETLERRVAEAIAALLQAQKLEAIGQLTGGVAHDFNNLLAIMSGGVQVLERHTDPAARQRVLEGMRRAVDRGTALTRHLLAFSRRRPVNPETIDLASHITGMREMLDHSLRGDVHVAMTFAPDLWPVELDAGEVELAMVNLCVNARDAMPEGGTVTIGAGNVSNPDEAGLHGDFVKLSVSDTGTGMPPEVLARVFEPFFTTKDVGKGSGLGLAQVYGFAQQSGGRVRIDSQVGSGTTVTLLLPRSHGTPAPSDRVAATSILRRTEVEGADRGQVLLVEDDGEVAALTGEMLRSIGFDVIHVVSAAAALGAVANSGAIDIVLSDIMMQGGVSGLELAHELRRRSPGLPVILTTGYAEAAAGVQDQGFGLLLKPYRIEALADTLSAHLKTRSAAARPLN